VRVSQPPVVPGSLNAHRVSGLLMCDGFVFWGVMLGVLLRQYFVMWGDADGKFFCPEPWLGAPNSLNTHEGIVVLKAGETFHWKYSVKATKLT
jgi:hypothetical protein